VTPLDHHTLGALPPTPVRVKGGEGEKGEGGGGREEKG